MKYVQFTKLYYSYDNQGNKLKESKFYILEDEEDEYEYLVGDENDDYEFFSTISFYDPEYPEDVLHMKHDDCVWEALYIDILEEA